MLHGLTPIDYGVIGLFLLMILAVGVYFAGQLRTLSDFAVAGRSLIGITAGVSVAATLLAAHQFSAVPGEAYEVGFKWLLAPIGVCLAAPLVMVFVLPLVSNLEITSIYEYLEMRFGPACRWAAAGVWMVWRIVWLIVVVAVPCHFVALVCGGVLPAWVWMLVVGVFATLTACLGGLKAVVWTDVIQTSAIVVALLIVVGAVLLSLDDGLATVWQVADDFNRTQVADLSLPEGKIPAGQPWSFYNALPFFVLLMLVLSVTDQTVLQRLLGTRNAGHCSRGYLAGTVIFALLLGGLTYVGVSLFAFYEQDANNLKPVWVVNLDNQTYESLTFADRDRILDEMDAAAAEAAESGDGVPVGLATSPPDGDDTPVTWDTPLRHGERLERLLAEGRILRPDNERPFKSVDELIEFRDDEPLVPWDTDLGDAATLERLVANKRILRPNSKRPFDRVDELIDFRTEELDVGVLAMGKAEGDLSNRVHRLVLHKRAERELLPYFVSSRLGMGLLGLVVVGVLAASMACFDSGVHSLSTVLLVDFHRRGGIGRSLLATRLGKSVAEITESDELKLARPLTVAVGILALAAALVSVTGIDPVWLLYLLTMIVGAPLLAVFALGILSRGATGAGAFAGLINGVLLTALVVIYLVVSADDNSGETAWPGPPWAGGWVMLCSMAFTFFVGWAVSLVAGQRLSKQDLRGLVWGIGRLGEQAIVHQAITIPVEEDRTPAIVVGPPPGSIDEAAPQLPADEVELQFPEDEVVVEVETSPDEVAAQLPTAVTTTIDQTAAEKEIGVVIRIFLLIGIPFSLLFGLLFLGSTAASVSAMTSDAETPVIAAFICVAIPVAAIAAITLSMVYAAWQMIRRNPRVQSLATFLCYVMYLGFPLFTIVGVMCSSRLGRHYRAYCSQRPLPPEGRRDQAGPVDNDDPRWRR